MHMRILRPLIFTCPVFLAPLFAAQPGILLLAHGGDPHWNGAVLEIAKATDKVMPTEVAFGMATRRTMQEAVNKLTTRGVTEIEAVPLFVSSHSSVLDSIAYLLGARTNAPEDLRIFAAMDHSNHSAHHAMDPSAVAENSKPVVSSAPIHMTEALNHHRTVTSILLDRAKSISLDPAREEILLVAHGPVDDEANRQWLADMKIIATAMAESSVYAGIEYLTVRDDAEEPVRNAATRELRARVQRLNAEGKTVLITPLLLSYGGIERGIRKRLEGLQYKMPSQALLPDARIAAWVLAMARAEKAD
jgi:sirohydrochlorin ferrochelatase